MRTRFYQNLLEKYGFIRTYAKKKIQIFLQFLFILLLYKYGFVKKDSNFVRSFYLLFEGAVTCRILFVDTTLATTALSKYV